MLVLPKRNLTETSKAYIAGLVDGEGCITISINRKYSENRFSIQPSVTITNCDKPLLNSVVEELGYGSIKDKTKHKGWKDSYSLVIPVNKICTFINLIRPYLRLKLGQAEKILEYFNYHTPIGSKNIPEDVWQNRLRVAHEIQYMNRRGNDDSSSS